jgi:tetratricopeptide (TPR) repeat protein
MRRTYRGADSGEDEPTLSAAESRRFRTMYATRSRIIGAAGFLIGAASVIPGLLRDSGAADGPPQTPPAVGSPKEAGKTIRQVLREAARAVQSAPDPASRTYALVEIIKAQGRAGDKEGALESARQATAAALALAPNPRCWALVAIAWARSVAGDREGALNALRLARRQAEEIGTDWGQVEALRMIATSQFDLGESAAATETIEKLRKIAVAIKPRGNNRVGPLGNLVWAQTYIGDDDGAFRTVEAAGAGDHHLQGRLYEKMVAAATADSGYYLQPPKTLDEGDRKVRRQVLDRIIKAVEPFEFAEERPDMQLAIGLASLGDFEAALRFAHQFGKGPIKHAHTIDLTAAPLVLSAVGGYQGKAGHLAEARRALQEALDMVRRDPALASRRLGQVALGQAEAGDVAGALKTVESLEPEQRVSFLMEMAEEQEKRGGMADSRVTFRRALEEAERCLRATRPQPASDRTPKGILRDADGKVIPRDRAEPEIQRKDDLLARMVKLHAKLGDLRAAVETFRSITGENYRGWAASDIADARSKAGDAEGALAWALALDTPTVRAWALRGLAAGALAGR